MRHLELSTSSRQYRCYHSSRVCYFVFALNRFPSALGISRRQIGHRGNALQTLRSLPSPKPCPADTARGGILFRRVLLPAGAAYLPGAVLFRPRRLTAGARRRRGCAGKNDDFRTGRAVMDPPDHWDRMQTGVSRRFRCRVPRSRGSVKRSLSGSTGQLGPSCPSPRGSR